MRRLVGIAVALGVAVACTPTQETSPPPIRYHDPVTLEADQPLRCMVDLDCLMHEVAVAAGITP